ncbi:MAG: phosphatase PAP2 family protein [Lachnospiraceae bacterium]|nr:phosphatase PAP2 family protein [Lachnospiraceae bacterium]
MSSEVKNRRRRKKINPVFPCITGALFLLLIVLVKYVDVSMVNETGTTIGLSHINMGFAAFTGVNVIWYKVTTVLGVFLLLFAGGFALIGLLQLIQRKSLLKVDYEILSLGGLYVVVVFLYALFEKVIINYRPILMDGKTEPEASFPSSHTMLVCVVMGSALMLIDRYIRDEKVARILKNICIVLIILTVVGRLICGVHWFTDILGGVLLSATLLMIFNNVLAMKKRRRK